MLTAYLPPRRRVGFVVVIVTALIALAGCSPPSILLTPVFDSPKLKEHTVQSGRFLDFNKIAIIEVEGLLANARIGGGLIGARENHLSLFTQQLERAEQDGSVKAVVLRVNSPGGTVTCSDAMYELVQRFKTRTGKPVIASFQEVAASGAYYVSCAADTIVAQPTSVCGSIGVIFSSFNIEGTMNLIGIKPETVKSGRLKDMASPFKPLAGEERKIVQEMIDSYHVRFVEVVQDGRSLQSDPAIADKTDGRIFTGAQAKALGLVDELGLLEDALAIARDRAKVPGAKAVMYKRPYGYSGSIYATQDPPPPQMNALHLPLPESAGLPNGFYYLWQP